MSWLRLVRKARMNATSIRCGSTPSLQPGEIGSCLFQRHSVRVLRRSQESQQFKYVFSLASFHLSTSCCSPGQSPKHAFCRCPEHGSLLEIPCDSNCILAVSPFRPSALSGTASLDVLNYGLTAPGGSAIFCFRCAVLKAFGSPA